MTKKEFKEKVCEQISLETKGISKFFVHTPFIFEDGDGFVIYLKYDKDKKRWFLTDEGHTFMHLSYYLEEDDFSSGTRETIIENTKKIFNVLEKEGELYLEIINNDFGNSLYNFVQAIMKISDITFVSRERTESTFIEDLKKSISKISEKHKLTPRFNYFIEKDKSELYPIDCYIETRCNQVMISIMPKKPLTEEIKERFKREITQWESDVLQKDLEIVKIEHNIDNIKTSLEYAIAQEKNKILAAEGMIKDYYFDVMNNVTLNALKAKKSDIIEKKRVLELNLKVRKSDLEKGYLVINPTRDELAREKLKQKMEDENAGQPKEEDCPCDRVCENCGGCLDSDICVC